MYGQALHSGAALPGGYWACLQREKPAKRFWPAIPIFSLKTLTRLPPIACVKLHRTARATGRQRDDEMLDEGIKKVRELPDSVQDDAAEMLFSVAAKQGEPARLDEETRAAIQDGRAQARRGEFVSDEDIRAFFERMVKR